MKQYTLVIKNEKLKSYDRIGWLVVLLNFISLLFVGINKKPAEGIVSGIVLFFFILIFFVGFRDKVAHPVERGKFATILVVLCGILWTRYNFYWPLILNIILVILHYFATKRFDVIINPERIIYPSVPKRDINWDELSNVILKDGLLTLDFNNNKLVQVEVVNDKADYNIDEKEFNAFCKQLLNK